MTDFTKCLHIYWDAYELPSKIKSHFESVCTKNNLKLAIWSNESVAPLFKGFEELKSFFDLLTIPSAKSDIARLIILYKLGGIYSDVWVHFHSDHLFKELHTDLENNHVLFREHGAEKRPVNGFIAARPESTFILRMLQLIQTNLISCWFDGGYTPKFLPQITGIGVIHEIIEKPVAGFNSLKYKHEKIVVKNLNTKIGYIDNKPIHQIKIHWSECICSIPLLKNSKRYRLYYCFNRQSMTYQVAANFVKNQLQALKSKKCTDLIQISKTDFFKKVSVAAPDELFVLIENNPFTNRYSPKPSTDRFLTLNIGNYETAQHAMSALASMLDLL